MFISGFTTLFTFVSTINCCRHHIMIQGNNMKIRRCGWQEFDIDNYTTILILNNKKGNPILFYGNSQTLGQSMEKTKDGTEKENITLKYNLYKKPQQHQKLGFGIMETYK